MTMLQAARCIVSFSWIYHGLFPKLIHIAPTERLIADSLGLSSDMSEFIIRSAGISEVFFGLALFIFYKSKPLVIINILGLVLLLSAVAILQSQLLIAAFNPVTTNLPLLALSLILLKHAKFELDKPN